MCTAVFVMGRCQCFDLQSQNILAEARQVAPSDWLTARGDHLAAFASDTQRSEGVAVLSRGDYGGQCCNAGRVIHRGLGGSVPIKPV